MEKTHKSMLIKDLIDTRNKRVWVAQNKAESIDSYNRKSAKLLHEYNNLGKLAQVELVEVTADCFQREQLAIYTYLKGLNPEIKRYIGEKERYQSLYQAQNHAKQIALHLEDLKRMKKATIIHTKVYQ